MSKIYQKTHPTGKNAGFTRIELLVVVLIIGILAAIALPKYEQAVAKARYMKLLPLVRAINDAENLYYMANGDYTLDFSELDIDMPAGGQIITEKQIKYDDFVCFMQKKTSFSKYSVYCNSTRDNMPRLEKYFTDQYFICWAASDNNKEYALCRTITGQSQHQTVSSDNRLGFYLR